MKCILFTLPVFLISFILKAELTLKAKTPEDKDLGCITLLKVASEKSKNAGEMRKYEKLKKLQKSFQGKYKHNHFSEKANQLRLKKLPVPLAKPGKICPMI